MPNAQCPMPNALCPMPNALCPMHVGYLMLRSKGYILALIQPSTPRLHHPALHPQKTVQFSTALSNIQTLDEKSSCQSHTNNLRLMLQPLISFNLIQQWLKVFPIPQLSTGLARLRALMSFYPNPLSHLVNQYSGQFLSSQSTIRQDWRKIRMV